MRETLFIFFPADFAQQSTESIRCRSLVQDSKGKFAGAESHDLNNLANAVAVDTRRARVVAVLPASAASLIDATVPKQMLRGSASRWQRALPFSLEDQLADEVDSLHFAMPPKSAINNELSDSQAGVPVAAIRRRDLDHLKTLLEDADLSAEHWTLETLLVPMPASGNGIGVVVCNDTALVRTGPMSGFSCPASMLPTFAKRLAQENHRQPADDSEDEAESPTETATDDEDAHLDIQCHALGLSHEQVEQFKEALTNDGHKLVLHSGSVDQFHGLLAQQFNLRELNLRQGDYSEQQAVNQYLRPWKWVAAAAVVMLCVEVFSGTWQIKRNNAVADNARQQTAVAFRDALPDVKRIQNPRVQMKQAIEAARGNDLGADFLSMLGAVSPEISALNNVDISTLGFRNETLELRLSADNVTTVDKLKERLGGLNNLSYKVISVNAGSDKVDFRINISALPPVAGL